MGDASICINCGRAVADPQQKFCPACGQPTPAHRIDWHFLGHELEHSVFHMDRGFLYTLKQLMLRPGRLIRNYIEGRRAGVVKPVLLIMMTGAAATLMAHYALDGDALGASLTAGMEAGAGHQGSLNAKQAEAMAQMANVFGVVKDWMNRHLTLITLLLLPVQAAAFKLTFRRFKQINYPEWLVITSFLMAQLFVVWVVFMPLQRWWSDAQVVMVLVAVLLNLFSLTQVFPGYSRWKAFLRGAAGWAIVQVVLMVATLIGAMVLGVLVGSGRIHLPA
ncbi:DUF3667 domain-containing protein [Pseudoxanthomonas sp. Root630]|uniref:DUF3667 domain-containing protein n=1 Tax=Pseudoxanthomonas sp. Root630 TaxID=1736574 RepID=UPI0007031CE7|nr:DUF3667 domain-containing protein [Pseudoxanthomonas sp. Root630]KRA51593.1 hypothetical protein ASD72_00380 [Pseudoxanthomonas sp. Root630]